MASKLPHYRHYKGQSLTNRDVYEFYLILLTLPPDPPTNKLVRFVPSKPVLNFGYIYIECGAVDVSPFVRVIVQSRAARRSRGLHVPI